MIGQAEEKQYIKKTTQQIVYKKRLHNEELAWKRGVIDATQSMQKGDGQ